MAIDIEPVRTCRRQSAGDREAVAVDGPERRSRRSSAACSATSLGHFIGNSIAFGYESISGGGGNDVAIVLGLTLGVVGFLLGSGSLNYPFSEAGRPRAAAPCTRDILGPVSQVHHGPQGGGAAVPVRGAACSSSPVGCSRWRSGPNC